MSRWQRCIADTENGTTTAIGVVEADERAAVSLTQDAHQGRKTHASVLRCVRTHGETDAVNPHAPLAGLVLAIDEVDTLHDGVDGRTRELIPEHVQADFLVLGVVGTNRLDDPFDRAGVGERVPGTQALENDATLFRRIRDPLSSVAGKHIRTLIVHDLET